MTPKAVKAPKAAKSSGPAAPPLVVNELICTRVQRFWPDEGGWFDAIITGASAFARYSRLTRPTLDH